MIHTDSVVTVNMAGNGLICPFPYENDIKINITAHKLKLLCPHVSISEELLCLLPVYVVSLQLNTELIGLSTTVYGHNNKTGYQQTAAQTVKQLSSGWTN